MVDQLRPESQVFILQHTRVFLSGKSRDIQTLPEVSRWLGGYCERRRLPDSCWIFLTHGSVFLNFMGSYDVSKGFVG